MKKNFLDIEIKLLDIQKDLKRSSGVLTIYIYNFGETFLCLNIEIYQYMSFLFLKQ